MAEEFAVLDHLRKAHELNGREVTLDYVPGGHSRQRLDVFAADRDADPRTAVLVLHGGALRVGDRSAVYARCAAFAARGSTAIAVAYRLLDSAAWPAQPEDARAALLWVHERARTSPKIVQLWTDDRIEALLAAMSWEEEPAQPQIGYLPRLADAVELVRGGIGAVFWPR